MTDSYFWDSWYFHVPNYLLAAVMYTLLARFFLQFFVPPGWDNYIWRWFQRLTNWAVALTRLVTPAALSPFWLPLFAALWLFFIRLALTIFFLQSGWIPSLEPGSAP